MVKIALFGGAFDPIHYGHLAAAMAALSQLHLDQVRFIPCADPVHKAHCIASSEQRAMMIQLAIRNQPHFILDPCELERASPSYAIDTIENFLDVHGSQKQLYWLLGADALVHFEAWHRWHDIIRLVDLVVVNRPGIGTEAIHAPLLRLATLLSEHGHGLHCVLMEPHPHASSTIRNTLGDDNAVPPLVKRYIDVTGLYR